MAESSKVLRYTDKDRQAILDIFKLNVPDFFAEEEYEDLERYLANELEDYFVLTHNHQVIGSGGINYETKHKRAVISWDLFHPNYQRKGFGSILLKHRLAYLATKNDIEQIIVRTSQITYPFYEKFGFQIDFIKKNYWAEGIDLYHMVFSNKA